MQNPAQRPSKTSPEVIQLVQFSEFSFGEPFRGISVSQQRHKPVTQLKRWKVSAERSTVVRVSKVGLVKSVSLGLGLRLALLSCSIMVRALACDSRDSRFDSGPSHCQVASDLGQIVHTHVPLSPSSIIRYQSQGSDAVGWEGNRRPVGLASHRPCVTTSAGFIHQRAEGLSGGGHENSSHTPHGAWYTLFRVRVRVYAGVSGTQVAC